VAIEVLEALEKVAESPAGDHRQRILAADAVGILVAKSSGASSAVWSGCRWL